MILKHHSAWQAYDKLIDRKHPSFGFWIREVADESRVCEDNLKEIRAHFFQSNLSYLVLSGDILTVSTIF